MTFQPSPPPHSPFCHLHRHGSSRSSFCFFSQNKMKHLIFLSHSGRQKGFARDLYNKLSSISYSVFFDIAHHSLPPGQPFPPLIFSAANTCKLAIVVLSHDFLSSRWPMIELCAFAKRLDSPSDSSLEVILLPLFFKLSPEDVKNEENLKQWRKAWEDFEQKDDRFSASKCEEAVTKLLTPRNGIVRRSEAEQGEASYLEEVIGAIFAILPPPAPFTDPTQNYSGRDRLCQVILDKFRLLENTRSPSQGSSILGMYGIPGTGKSTLCRFLCDSVFNEFNGNVIHIELPTDSDSKVSLVKEKCADFLSKFNPCVKDITSMDLDKMLHLIDHSMSIKAFLVFDNISASNSEIYEKLFRVLLSSAALRHGSRIMLVAQSPTILKYLERLMEDRGYSSKYRYAIMEVPCLTEEEAIDVIRNQCPRMKEELRTHLLSKISFPRSSFIYIPFVFEQIGVLFRNFDCGDVEKVDLDRLTELVNEGKKNAVQKLVETNFKLLREDLQVLFLDIALFIIPAGYSDLDDATPILARMHGISNTGLDWKIKDLQRHCTLSAMNNQLRIHDIFAEYAERIAENSASHVFQPSLGSSGSLVNIDPARKQYWQNPLRTRDPQRVHLKFLEARSIYIGIRTELLHHYHMNYAELVSCDDHKVHMHVAVGARTKALMVRNSCLYFNCILDLCGDLSSLVCFGTENMEQVTFSPCGNDGNLPNLIRLELRKKNETRSSQTREPTGISSLDFMSHQIERTTQSVRWILKPFLLRWEQQIVSNFISSGRMRGLQTLILHDFAGIFRMDMCPQLEILDITSKRKEKMDVRIEKAPKLKEFVARCADWDPDFRGRAKQLNKLALQLKECPELETIYVDDSFEKVKVDGLLPSKLQSLTLADFGSPEFFPLNLISASAHQLSELRSISLDWTKVGKLQVTREHLGYLPKLEELFLEDCTGLTHVSVDGGCVPNLVCLHVGYCDELQVLEGDTTLMEKLEELRLYYLPQLRWECNVMLRSLRRLDVQRCPQVRIDVNVLKASKNLAAVRLEGRGDTAVVEKKQQQAMENNGGAGESQVWVALNRWIFSYCQFMFLWSLSITGLRDLQEIEGVQHLYSLVDLSLSNLPNLVRLSGAWPPRIQDIRIRDCPMLLEVAPIQETPRLDVLCFHGCVSLKAVEVGHSHSLYRVEFVKCESMEAFPMEGQPLFMNEWGKKKRSEYSSFLSVNGSKFAIEEWVEKKRSEYSPFVNVRGSKFASEEAMEKWLREAEEGSPLYRAAVEALGSAGSIHVDG